MPGVRASPGVPPGVAVRQKVEPRADRPESPRQAPVSRQAGALSIQDIFALAPGLAANRGLSGSKACGTPAARCIRCI